MLLGFVEELGQDVDSILENSIVGEEDGPEESDPQGVAIAEGKEAAGGFGLVSVGPLMGSADSSGRDGDTCWQVDDRERENN